MKLLRERLESIDRNEFGVRRHVGFAGVALRQLESAGKKMPGASRAS